MFGRKKEKQPEQPKEKFKVNYNGKNILSLSFWNSQEYKYEIIDDYISKGYDLMTMAGMDGYIVTFRKPKKLEGTN